MFDCSDVRVHDESLNIDFKVSKIVTLLGVGNKHEVLLDYIRTMNVFML